MKLSEIKGLGLTTEKYLNDLGIETAEDLVNYLPFRYEILENTDINSLSDGDKVVMSAVVESIPSVIYFRGKNKNKMMFRIGAGCFNFNVHIFNRAAYLKSKLYIGMEITVIGKFNKMSSTIVASNIKFGHISETIIEPIYHSSFKISSSKISKFIKLSLDKINIDDFIPDYLSKKYNFINKNDAIKIIHEPKDKKSLKKALERFKYEELFVYMLKINYLKKYRKQENGLSRNVSYSKIEKFIESLPFRLTSDQKKAVADIYDDLTSSERMNRLLQGDVGSGKTVVSFIALYINYLSGYQGALMAPTEILAYQHFLSIKKMLPSLNVVLLKGKMNAKEKRKAKEAIENGDADIIIGTHALISKDVIYKNLGLVITDEQHRFGVNQRGSLKNKGITPDILYMSATPIPRTYALTLYGDMDISSIKTMPKGRKPVKTYLKKNSEIKDVLFMIYGELKKGHQIYVVAPLVEESENISLENVYKLEEGMNKAFKGKINVGVLHGKMNANDKQKVMDDFKNNIIKILISTTVIEVGVDVANATMMVIFDSFRFGLSALHQLRGRVGRNDLDSYCILISDKETKRLEVLTKTNDGFKVSEEDYKMRGGGDIFGVRQSGDESFKLANEKSDFDLILKAKEDSIEFMNSYMFFDVKYEQIRNLAVNSINQD